ncbi:23S rRNA (adenine(2503)-C(2))-methyltransferase RlmN [Peptoniphilus asaccharolyticus]|nr:23S rRNA (adenine(2503)-C(2))-methyltransferase RlmN [Peptoniphilus asaccharolyticus]MBL7575274.1 23S rRNA (adenine(2503)-C(2))-methyltransferase RlmN [Peptoniphilus asaccharolyticus]
MKINNMALAELQEWTQQNGYPKFRAKQIYTFFNKNQRIDIENSNLSKDIIEAVGSDLDIAEIECEFSSKLDSTKKYLFKLNDGNLVEGVLMKYKHGYSQCISTQVGCRMGCVFCASTKAGLIRNLAPAEMLRQVYSVENKLGIRVSNIILMGSGEPLDNYENVIKFLKIFHSEEGHNMSYRNMTISTCGVVDRIYDLAKENLPITLAISLHSPNDETRSKVLPINRKYNLDKLIEACKYYSEETKSRITFEYTLISGENSSLSDAEELFDLLKGLKYHINLIPLNSIEEYQKGRPSIEEIEKFKSKLISYGAEVTVRRELGKDISASCGQLRRKYEGGINEVCS